MVTSSLAGTVGIGSTGGTAHSPLSSCWPPRAPE